jgi:DNA-binding transcriptional MerR regulator
VRQEYTLAELAAAVGMTERNIRAYRSRGLIPPPRLRGRVGYYGFDHLAQLRLVQALTGRGLSLGVVSQLLDRGLAQHELSRLIREELPGGLPMTVRPAVVEEVRSADAEVVETLIEHGVCRRTEQGVVADPALMSLANQLVADGVPLLEVTQLCLAGVEAAAAAQQRVRRTLRTTRRPPVCERHAPSCATDANPEVPGDREDIDVEPQPDAATTALVLELTTTAFRLALETRLSRREP